MKFIIKDFIQKKKNTGIKNKTMSIYKDQKPI